MKDLAQMFRKSCPLLHLAGYCMTHTSGLRCIMIIIVNTSAFIMTPICVVDDEICRSVLRTSVASVFVSSFPSAVFVAFTGMYG